MISQIHSLQLNAKTVLIFVQKWTLSSSGLLRHLRTNRCIIPNSDVAQTHVALRPCDATDGNQVGVYYSSMNIM